MGSGGEEEGGEEGEREVSRFGGAGGEVDLKGFGDAEEEENGEGGEGGGEPGALPEPDSGGVEEEFVTKEAEGAGALDLDEGAEG